MKSERISPFWVNGYQPFSVGYKKGYLVIHHNRYPSELKIQLMLIQVAYSSTSPFSLYTRVAVFSSWSTNTTL